MPVQLPAALQSRATHFAELDGVSVEKWIADAVASKVETAEFFHRRSQGASGKSLMEILNAVPNNPPVSGDELPEGWKRP